MGISKDRQSIGHLDVTTKLPETSTSQWPAFSGYLQIALFVGLIITVSGAALASTRPGEVVSTNFSQANKLSGGFIQLWQDLLDESAWRRVLDAMIKADMHHRIIIQRLEVRAKDGTEYKYYPANRKDFDPTKFILDYADARDDMQVYVGLREDQSFQSNSNWNNGDSYAHSLNNQGGELGKNKALAKEAWARYGIAADGKIRRSFAGWYLPNEMWNQNYTRVQLLELRRFHRELSAYCKSFGTSNLRVVISPYFNPNLSELPNLLDPDAFSKMFGEFLHPEGTQRATGIDIVMLQDGAGERRLKPADIQQTVEPYDLSFRAMAQTKGIHLWATVESWKYNSQNSFFPSEIDRLSKQIEVEGPLVEALVTFEFFHYMNPYGDFHAGAWKEAEKNLYWCYVRRFAPSAIRPSDPACLDLTSH